VLFAAIQNNTELEKLQQIAGIVRKCFASRAIPVTDNRPFQPHLTIAKLSKDARTRRTLKKIPAEVIGGYEQHVFGTEKVQNIQLCSMQRPHDETTGYYWTPKQLQLF